MKTLLRFQAILFGIVLCALPLQSQLNVQFDYSGAQQVNNLVGFNTGFDHRYWVERSSSSGITTYTDSIRQDVKAAIAGLGHPVLRFPGGVIANFFHLYDPGVSCPGPSPCIQSFTSGYGLRQQEVATFNNGAGSVAAEYNFEQNSNIALTDNWIVTFADMIEELEQQGKDIEVIYMANVLAHFKFGTQAAAFSGDTPQLTSVDFQAQLQETAHALQYLIDVRGLSVNKVELGTELYFQSWERNNDVNIDRFISLIPIYRNLLDSLGYQHIALAVPFHHEHSLNPNADNWSRKLADSSYHDFHVYDAFIIHDYQRMVERCNVVLGNCRNCNNWVDDECSLYNGNPNILNCEPDRHSPSSADLELVYQKKNKRFAEAFNGGLAIEYEHILSELRGLSGLSNATLWLTEWNEVFDAGCDGWKGINQFFPNTFAHAANIYDILHSLNDKNATSANEFIEVATFHTLSASNLLYPIINVKDSIIYNGCYYPFLFTGKIQDAGLHHISMQAMDTSISPDMLSFHAYLDTSGQAGDEVYLFFSNKTDSIFQLQFDNLSSGSMIQEAFIRYIQGEALHSSVGGEYRFNSNNVTAAPLNYNHAENEEPFASPYNLPAYSLGYIRLRYSKGPDGLDEDSFSENIRAFPNPAHSELNIHQKRPELLKIELLSMDGKQVLIKETNDQDFSLMLSSLASGLYLLSVRGEKGVVFKKIIKQ